MIRGDCQVEIFDYNKTSAPATKMRSVRCFLSVTVAKNWEFHQMNVNNALLHIDLEEEVFMKIPPRFSTSSPNKVCCL